MVNYKDQIYLLKIVVVGESCVGKTSLAECFIDGKLNTDKHIPTIAIEFLSKDVSIKNHKYKLHIWDTAGQERFRAITRSYYKNAVGALACFKITNRTTFEKVVDYIEDIIMYSAHNIQIVLVGTHLDQEDDRQVTYEEALSLANKYGLPYIETSSVHNINVTETFNKVIEMVGMKYNEGSIILKPFNYNSLKLDESDKSNFTSCCN